MQLSFDHPLIEDLIHDNQDAIVCLDGDLTVTKINIAFLQLFQIPKEKLIGQSLKRVFQQHQLACPIQEKFTITDALTPITLQTQHVDLSNNAITLNWSIYLVTHDHHATTLFLRCKTETQFWEDSFINSAIVKSSPCSIYWKDKNGAYLGCNEYSLKMMNANSVEDIIGKKDNAMSWREHYAEIRAVDQAVIQNNETITLEETGLLDNGQQIWLISTKIPLHNNHNQVIGLIGISIDISELKKKMQAAQHNAELLSIYLKNILSTIPCSVYWKDLKGYYLGCNQYVSDMTGLAEDDLVGKTDFDLPWRAQAEAICENDNQVMYEGKTVSREEPAIIAENNNKVRTYLSVKAPLRDLNNKIIGLVGNSIDITQIKDVQKKLEHEKQKAEVANLAKTEFLASMSHDFRTPLNAILGFSEILMMKNNYTDSEKREFVRSIQSAGNVLLRLIDDILIFSKVESGKMEHYSEPFNLRNMVEDIARMLSIETNKKALDFIVSYHESMPHLFIGDAQRIRRIILNLLNNAVKFTENGHVLLSIDCLTQKAGLTQIQITIEDTGIGIPEDKIDSIFDRFSRVEPSYRSKYKGTGLGLAIVKELVQELNGTISAHSIEGKGTTFICTLPLKQQENIAPQARSFGQYGTPQVLIVDDSDLRAMTLKKHIDSEHCTTTTSQALTDNSLDLAAYQIILIDENLKAQNTIALATQIRKNEAYKQILLLCMAKPVSSDAYARYIDAGFFDVLIKPIQPSELSQALFKNWTNWRRQFSDDKTLLQSFGANVLLVEDDAASQKVATLFLEQLGCKVEHADSYESAIDLMDHRFHIALIDIGLPDKSGLDLIQTFRNGPYKNIPLVILSAHISEKDHKTFIAAGANAVLSKPINVDKLTNLLAKFLLFQYNSPK